MSEQTGISWTDSTFNPWMGCTKVSPACEHCYAERDTKRFGRVEWGAGKPRVRTVASNWKKVERWNNAEFYACPSCGWRGEGWICGNALSAGSGLSGCRGTPVRARRRVFSASLADWLDNEVPIEWLVDFLDLVRRTPNLDWLLLTKRIGNWRNRLGEAFMWLAAKLQRTSEQEATWAFIDGWLKGMSPAHVWIGATVVNQTEADRDVPKLLAVPARVRFLSIEPMLGPVDLSTDFDLYRYDDGSPWAKRNVGTFDHGIHWVIAGGESGPHARPMHRDWVHSLRDQCATAGVAFHFKQWGEWAPNWLYEDDLKTEKPGSMWMDRMGKKVAGRHLDGVEHNEFPTPKEPA